MKKMNLGLAMVIAAGAVAASPVTASTMNLLENGSFERNQFRGSWKVFQGTDMTGWEVTSGAGVEIQKNAVGSVLDTPFGNQYVELDSGNRNGGLTSGPTNSTIAQSLMMDAGQYDMSFWYSPRTKSADDNGIYFEVNTAQNDPRTGVQSVDVLASGVADGPSVAFPHGEWTRVSKRFTIDQDETFVNLLFSATGNDNTLGGLIDNASISAVPLPASSLLLIAGLGGLAAMRRRKTA